MRFVGVVMVVVNSILGMACMCSHQLPEGVVLSLKALQKVVVYASLTAACYIGVYVFNQ